MFSKLFNKTTPSEWGLVINWGFHRKNKWVAAVTPYLVNAIVAEFNPVIISNQRLYDRHKHQIRYLLSVEPGWAAPRLNYDTNVKCRKAVFYSDPHYNTAERWEFFSKNQFDYVFSYYKGPFFYHFKGFPKKQFVHLPWAVPDQFIGDHPLKVKGGKVAIFGSKDSDAYDMRNWCRKQEGVRNFSHGGVENKEMTDDGYFKWLSTIDCIIAAGSTRPEYGMVTPKYFEIASAGALLFAHDCDDLKTIGFDEYNALIFKDKKQFNQLLNQYISDPSIFLPIRYAGRELISQKHKVSDRIHKIKEVMYGFK